MSTYFDDASLVMIPSGYKDDKLYSIKPTSGDGDFTFSRDGSGASPATRVNSAGLIEKGRTNLLLQSNSFDTTWGNSNTTETSGQSGYDGTNDAWLLTKSAASGYLIQSISSTGVQTFSVYAKAGTLNWIRLNVNFTSGTDPIVYFDLANGVVGTSTGEIDTDITSIGNDWYRCSVTANGTISDVRFFPADGDNDVSGTSGNIYIQDAQLEKGLVSTSVIETTTAAASAGILGDMPRLDYSGGASCPSLLLEPARTNLFTHSEYLDGFTTAGSPAPTLTANYAESPEGVNNAYRVEIPSVSGLSLMAQLVSHTSGTDMTISAYVKSNVASDQSFKLFGDYATGAGTSGTLTATSEWQRFTFTFTPTATGNRNAGILNLANTAADLLVYGMQIETASYPTSYVPTYGSATARAKDFFVMNLITNGITTASQTEATLFIEFEKPNTGENVDLMRFRGTGTLGRGYIYNTGVGFASDWGQSLNFTIGENTKAVWRVNSLTDGEVFLNGTKSNNASGTAWSGFWTIRFNEEGGGGVLKIKQIALFPTALTDAECISLTT